MNSKAHIAFHSMRFRSFEETDVCLRGKGLQAASEMNWQRIAHLAFAHPATFRAILAGSPKHENAESRALTKFRHFEERLEQSNPRGSESYRVGERPSLEDEGTLRVLESRDLANRNRYFTRKRCQRSSAEIQPKTLKE